MTDTRKQKIEERQRFRAISAVILVISAMCAGCQPHAENKKLAYIRWQKSMAKVKLKTAENQYDSGKYDEAARSIAECISADLNTPQVHLLSGKVLMSQGRPKQAREQLKIVVDLDEETDLGWYLLGVLCQQQQQFSQACRYYTKAMELKPNNADYILGLAEIYVARGEYEQATELLETKIAALPGQSRLIAAAGDLMLRSSCLEDAIQYYKRAILLNANDVESTRSLGHCYVLDKQWDEAANIFEQLLRQCDNENARQTYLDVLARCSMNKARYSKAVNCYGELSRSQDDNAQFWLHMGQAALGAGGANRAFICSQRALFLRPGWPDALALMGGAQYANEDYQRAIKSFEKIVEEKSTSGFAWLMIGRCYQQLGDMTTARDAYRKALQLKPNSGLANVLAKDAGLGGNRLNFGF